MAAKISLFIKSLIFPWFYEIFNKIIRKHKERFALNLSNLVFLI